MSDLEKNCSISINSLTDAKSSTETNWICSKAFMPSLRISKLLCHPKGPTLPHLFWLLLVALKALQAIFQWRRFVYDLY
ncbi:MAG: hypothetical protein REH83_01545 [Rickettsiella sp.]|nr:hypothetical protein [Rickettsiella sp.]